MSVLTFKSDEYKLFPPIIKDYASYQYSIKGNSEKTVCEYLLDIRTFFRFIKAKNSSVDYTREEFLKISIADITLDDVRAISESDVIEFLKFSGYERENNNTTRTRKLSSLRSFFRYMHGRKHLIDSNPAAEVDSPKKSRTLPKYLSLEEALALLETVKNDTASPTVKRDFAMISLFLNTGMRLSELVGLNIESFNRDLTEVKVKGKGNKERIIFINDAAQDALKEHLKTRLDPRYVRTGDHAMFLSRLEKRISGKTVQWVVYKYLNLAGLGQKKLSVHKLRHTAATLMYQSGKVDIRVLKDVLGHEQLNTTQIYTHLVNEDIQSALNSNPLASVKITVDKNKVEDWTDEK